MAVIDLVHPELPMKLEVLIGMIASGKSTYARRRADDGALVICHDDLTQMLHARYRYEKSHKHLYRLMMSSLAHHALNVGVDVVVDRTHLTYDSRKIWTDIHWARKAFAPNEGLEIVAVTFPIHAPSLHAERRFKSDSRGRPFEEWLNVAHHHFGQAQEEPLDWQREGFNAHVPIAAFEPSKADDPTPQPVRA